MELTFQRCLNHAGREAIARCPSCANFFCRECVTEHAGKFLCSNCLQRNSVSAKPVNRTAGWIRTLLGMIIGLSVAWFFFYLIGQLLILIPANLHDITYLKDLL